MTVLNKLYVLNEVYLGVKIGGYLQVLVDRNKGGPLHPHPFISASDNLREATTKDLEKFPLMADRYEINKTEEHNNAT